MRILVCIIAILNVLVLFEIIKSDIWRSKRWKSVSCVKSMFCVMVFENIITLIALGVYYYVDLKDALPTHIELLFITVFTSSAIVSHQIICVINRRRIIRIRGRKGGDRTRAG